MDGYLSDVDECSCRVLCLVGSKSVKVLRRLAMYAFKHDTCHLELDVVWYFQPMKILHA